MKLIENENVVFCDVDETLVVWDKEYQHEKVSRDNEIILKDPYTGDTLYLQRHMPHIRLLKQYKGRGFTIIVWSKAGCKWSEEVVKKLGLEEYVDYCMTKPDRYLDDKTNPEEIIGVRVYLNNNV